MILKTGIIILSLLSFSIPFAIGYVIDKIIHFSHGQELVHFAYLIIYNLIFLGIFPIYFFISFLVDKTKIEILKKASAAVNMLSGSLLYFFIFAIFNLISDKNYHNLKMYFYYLNKDFPCKSSFSSIIDDILILTVLLIIMLYIGYIIIKRTIKTFENDLYIIKNIKLYIKINYLYCFLISLTVFGIIFSIPCFYINFQTDKIIDSPSDIKRFKKLRIVFFIFVFLWVLLLLTTILNKG